jgi:hypothetical protein
MRPVFGVYGSCMSVAEPVMCLQYRGRAPVELSAVATGRRFQKDIIHVGEYTHPVKGWRLSVDHARLDKWVSAFNRMKAAGVTVPVTVDHSDKADGIRGEIVEMRREGDDLIAVHELRLGDGVAMAMTPGVEVSIEIEPDFQDGQGRQYGEAITASSLVQRPVVPNQRRFIALSLQEKDQPMLTPKSLSRITKALGMTDPADDANVEALLDEIGTKLEAALAAGKEVEPLKASLKDVTTKLAAATKPAELDPEVAGMLAEGVEAKIERLLSLGYTPAYLNGLKPHLVNGAYMLSRAANDNKTSRANAILDLMLNNPPVVLGHRTGEQKKLSLTSEGDAEDNAFTGRVKASFARVSGK